MGKHKTCSVCFKTMRSDVFERQLMRRDHLMDDNEGIGKTEGQQISYASVTDEELENEVIHINGEFNRKIELGRYVKLLVDQHGFNENGLDNDMKDALKTYELHGKTKEDMYKCTGKGYELS